MSNYIGQNSTHGFWVEPVAFKPGFEVIAEPRSGNKGLSIPRVYRTRELAVRAAKRRIAKG